MQRTKVDTKRLGNMGLIIPFLLMLFGIIDYFVNPDNYSITIILLSFAALFSSIKMRAKKDLPLLRFAVGLCIALALFSQAILIQNQYFAIFGFMTLIVFAVDYVKYSKHTKNQNRHKHL